MPYPVAGAALTIEKAEYTDQTMPNLFGPNLPDPGTHYLVFTIRVRNESGAPVVWGFDRFRPTLTAGGQVIRGINLLTAKNEKFETQPINPGEEKELRFHFQVPKTAPVATLTLQSGSNIPPYVFDLSAVH
jgi:hypothetical protein